MKRILGVLQRASQWAIHIEHHTVSPGFVAYLRAQDPNELCARWFGWPLPEEKDKTRGGTK